MSGAGSIRTLRAGPARARIAPHLGGRITACELVGPYGEAQPVLQAYSETHGDLDNWAKGGLYPLAPYSGRLRDAKVLHEGHEWLLQPHQGSRHTLHGIAQRRPWDLVELGPDHASLRYRHRPDAHWRWAFEALMAVSLEPSSLSVSITLCNSGPVTMPGGIGLHPYILHDAEEAVCYRASRPWPFDDDYLALAVPPHMSSDTVCDQVLTHARFRSAEVTLFHGAWHDALQVIDTRTGHSRLDLRASGALTQLVIHRPASATYLCAEPVSHVADGFNLAAHGQADTGTRVLRPGERMKGTLVLSVPALAHV